MDGIITNTKAAAGASVPTPADTPRVALDDKKVTDSIAALLPADQSVQAAGDVEKEGGIKDSALARVEKALSEAFGESFANSRLEVEKHEESGRYVYKAVNKESGQVERQFPSEDMLKILSSIEGRDGKFLDDTA